MSRHLVVVSWLALVSLAACRDEERCLKLRQEGFDVLNGAHPCNDDSDCQVSVWPACGKPLNGKTDARLLELERRSKEASCSPDPVACSGNEEVYCDRNFCILRPVPLGR